jgi:hypothetical protein
LTGKVVASELIGVALIMNDISSFLGLQCWKESITLRLFPTYGEPSLPKITWMFHMRPPLWIFGFSVEEDLFKRRNGSVSLAVGGR